MQVKELIKILKRFPSSSEVMLEDGAVENVNAQVDQDGHWQVVLKAGLQDTSAAEIDTEKTF